MITSYVWRKLICLVAYVRSSCAGLWWLVRTILTSTLNADKYIASHKLYSISYYTSSAPKYHIMSYVITHIYTAFILMRRTSAKPYAARVHTNYMLLCVVCMCVNQRIWPVNSTITCAELMHIYSYILYESVLRVANARFGARNTLLWGGHNYLCLCTRARSFARSFFAYARATRKTHISNHTCVSECIRILL